MYSSKNVYLTLVSAVQPSVTAGHIRNLLWSHGLYAQLLSKNSSKLTSSFMQQIQAQLLQRDCTTLRIIEYFAKSLKVTKGHSKC